MLGVVTLRYPKLNEPDTRGKFADNKYKTDVIPSPENLKKFKEWALSVAKEKGMDLEGLKLPIRKDKKDKDAPAFVTLKSRKLNDKPMKPILVDSMRQPIPAGVRIRGGTTARVAGQLSNYPGGLYLQLEAVQVLDLVEDTSQGADAFDAVEDGYVAPDAPATEDETEGTEQSGTSYAL
jgi:hypothetical protein